MEEDAETLECPVLGKILLSFGIKMINLDVFYEGGNLLTPDDPLWSVKC